MSIADFFSTCLGTLTVIKVYTLALKWQQPYPEDDEKINVVIAGFCALVAGGLVFVVTNQIFKAIHLYGPT